VCVCVCLFSYQYSLLCMPIAMCTRDNSCACSQTHRQHTHIHTPIHTRTQTDSTHTHTWEVSIISIAFCSPTKRGKRCVPPKPGMMPSCNSGRPRRVPGTHTRALQAMATSRPPPKATPCESGSGRGVCA